MTTDHLRFVLLVHALHHDSASTVIDMLPNQLEACNALSRSSLPIQAASESTSDRARLRCLPCTYLHIESILDRLHLLVLHLGFDSCTGNGDWQLGKAFIIQGLIRSPSCLSTLFIPLFTPHKLFALLILQLDFKPTLQFKGV